MLTVMPRPVDIGAVEHIGFGLAEDLGPFHADAHSHPRHQLLYARAGTMALVAGGRRWLLPPQRAGWIPAGVVHEVRSEGGVELRTAYLDPSLCPDAPSACAVFPTTPLAREMLLFATELPAARADASRERLRAPFFAAVGAMVSEWVRGDDAYCLPLARSEELRRAVDHIEANVAEATASSTADAAHVSQRTLSRRFEEEMGVSFRDYLQLARMLRALELLAAPRATVSQVAIAVGFQSPGAFTTAFRTHFGVPPSEYRA
jgi:AraC-like DNA-binding protein